MKNKFEAIDKFKEFKLEVEKQLERFIKTLNNDRGRIEAMDNLCKENRIKHWYTMPYKP